MKKYQIGIAAVLFLGVLAAGVFAMGFRGHSDPALTAAIKADDYTAFTTAVNGTNVTQTQFEKIVAGYKNGAARRDQMQKSMDAIKNNDYAAWTAAGHNETQAQFTTLVQTSVARQKVQQAISSNDFASWKQAMTDLLQLQSDGLTQENFDKIVAHKNAMTAGAGHGFRHRGFHLGKPAQPTA